jgi:hypothetical protein
MKHQIFRTAALALGLSIIYSGVVGAFPSCLHDTHHDSHGAGVDAHEHPQARLFDDYSEGGAAPVVHCTPLTERVGPAALVKSSDPFNLKQLLQLARFSIPPATSAHIQNQLWKEALFKIISKSPSPRGLVRHLLSLLQI